MCCSRRPRDENIIRTQSKLPIPSCCGHPEEEDGWSQGKDNIGFKHTKKNKSSSNVKQRTKGRRSNSRRGTVHPQ